MANEKRNTSMLSTPHSIINGGSYTQHNTYVHCAHNSTKAQAGYDQLLEFVAPAALHDSGHDIDPPKCHPNTRVAVIQRILDWASEVESDKREKFIMWLSGAAGSGKSSIGRTVAERWAAEGKLLASFFFSATDSTRNNPRTLVSTIAYQMCVIHPSLQDTISAVVDDDPLIFTRSLHTQFLAFLVRPLSMIFGNTPRHPARIIIIDGLDECENPGNQCHILATLLDLDIADALPIQFLVCSRPENQITSTFGSTRMRGYHTRLFLDDQYHPDKDIEKYLRHNFDEIKTSHIFKHQIPIDWPGNDVIDTLVKTSSGQFIYASTAVRYMRSSRHRPHQRLEVILGLRPYFKGSDLPFAQLDALYMHIFLKVNNLPLVLDILAFPIIYGRYNISNIEKVLGLEQGDIEIALSDLQSIATINYREDATLAYITLLHKSIEDFLLDQERSRAIFLDPISRIVKNIAHVIQSFSETSKKCRPGYLSQGSFCLLTCDDRYLADVSRSKIIVDVFAQFPMRDFSKALFVHKKRNCPEANFLAQFFGLLSSLDSEAARYCHLIHLYSYFKSFLTELNGPYFNDHAAHFVFSLCWIMPARITTRENHFSGWRIDDYAIFLNDQMKNIMSGFPEIPHILLPHSMRTQILSRAATFCLSFLCDMVDPHEEASKFLRITELHRLIRREHPRKWREQYRSRYTPTNQLVIQWDGRYRVKRFREAIKSPYNESPFTSIQPIHDHNKYLVRHTFIAPQNWTLYVSLLDKLLYLLPLSGPYGELIELCSRKTFASMSMMFPKESRKGSKVPK